MIEIANRRWEALDDHQGDWMKKALVFAGINGKTMADYLDVDVATVSRWVNGKLKPSKQTLRLWAMRTGLPLSYLEDGIKPTEGLPSDYQSALSRTPLVRKTRPTNRAGSTGPKGRTR